MKVIGLTGGIGSGKSVVAELLKMSGIPVYDSDSRSKSLCDTDEDLKMGLTALFGGALYAEGLLNRSWLAERIFKDEKALKAANALIHPAVERDFLKWVKAHEAFPATAMETAILFEAGLEHLFDRIICVTAPEELRIERVCKRSGLDASVVKARIQNQMTDDQRASRSDVVVVNDDTHALIPQVLEIVRSLS